MKTLKLATDVTGAIAIARIAHVLFRRFVTIDGSFATIAIAIVANVTAFTTEI